MSLLSVCLFSLCVSLVSVSLHASRDGYFTSGTDFAMSPDGLMAEEKLKKSAPVLSESSSSALGETPSFPHGSGKKSELKTYPPVFDSCR